MAVVLNALFKSVKYLGMHFGIKTLHKIKFYFVNRIVGEMGDDVPGAILSTAPHFGQPSLLLPHFPHLAA